ncbi:hypothetical protein BD414DRAFT_524369 [Trametes punicea]|nr:hypothetical protein BD414DRAFT_524369 [Trametes punicea]
MATNLIPPAPPLPGEARLEIFVHPEGLPPNRPLEENNKFSDARRLELLGTKMLELAYMDVLRTRWAGATAQQLKPSSSKQIVAIMAIPPAPQLPGEALLEIFVHPDSLPHNCGLDDGNQFSDGRRLEVLGERMAKAAYMDVMCTKWPNVNTTQLTTLVDSTISGFMVKVVNTYRWREAVHGCPPHLVQGHEEAHRLFKTYAGAVHIQYGFQRLRDWIAALTEI